MCNEEWAFCGTTMADGAGFLEKIGPVDEDEDDVNEKPVAEEIIDSAIEE